jgi:hypothetical protein
MDTRLLTDPSTVVQVPEPSLREQVARRPVTLGTLFKAMAATVALCVLLAATAGYVAANALDTPGPRGVQGQTGAMGPQGPQGEHGKRGKAGTDGANGVNGANGLDGVDGANGLDGVDGANTVESACSNDEDVPLPYC